jgi:C1A family cysteine protease
VAQNYKSGVLKDTTVSTATCSTSTVGHSVLLVGYGTDATDGPYWIIKNSCKSDAC